MRLLLKGFANVLLKGIGADMERKYPGGSWVTIHGRHVYVHNGRIVPETAWPGMQYEHHIMARNAANKTVAAASSAAATVKDTSSPGDRAIAAIEKFEQQHGFGASGWFIVPKKGNNTFEHRDRLKAVGAQWKGTGDEEGWHIPVKLGSGHAALALKYLMENGLKGAFRKDGAAPPPKGASAGAPTPKPGSAPASQGAATDWDATRDRLVAEWEAAMRTLSGTPKGVQNEAAAIVARKHGLTPYKGMTINNVLRDLKALMEQEKQEKADSAPTQNEGIRQAEEARKIRTDVANFIGDRFVFHVKQGVGGAEAGDKARQDAAKNWGVTAHAKDNDGDIGLRVISKVQTGADNYKNWHQEEEARKARLESERAAGLKIDVKIYGVGGKGYIGLKFTGFDASDKTHRSFKNLVQKMDTAYQNGVWIFKGDGAKIFKQIEDLHGKFGPMMNISEVVQKHMTEHNPEFGKKLKASGDRAAAGLAAQQVEDPLKLKSLKTKTDDGRPIKPHGYQWSGVHYLTAAEKGVLGFGTGLGKTLTSLLAAEHAMANLDAKGPAKIIVPATRLYGWQEEINTFFKGKKVVVIDGGPEERKKLYKEAKKADYVIMSYATMTNEGALLAKELPGDIAIYDEAHYLKDPKSARSKAAFEHGSPKFTWWLTATPMMNNLDETYRAMEFMNPGVLGEKKQFMQKFALKDDVTTMTGNVTQQVVGVKPNERENLKKLIGPYFFMLDKQNERVKIAMPPKTHQRETLDMDPHQRALYNALRSDVLANLEGQSDTAPVEMHILTKLMRLEQIAINPKLIVPVADTLGIKSTNPALKAVAAKGYVAPKLQEAASKIAENWERTNEDNGGKGGKGTIVFAQSPETLDAVKQHLKAEHGFTDSDFTMVTGAHSKKDRAAAEAYFNSGKAKVILATKAANEGMNLQKNSNMHIDLDYEWNPSSMEQRLGRGYRQGQTQDFHHHQYVMRDSIEGPKLSLLARKAGIIGDVFGDSGSAGAPKGGSGLTAADIYELLGADQATINRVRAASEAAVKAAKENRATKNAKATAKAVADEAKAAAKAEAAPRTRKTKAEVPPAPAAKPKTARELNREMREKVKADNAGAMEKLYGKGSGSIADSVASAKPIIRDATTGKTTQSKKTGYQLAEEAAAKKASTKKTATQKVTESKAPKSSTNTAKGARKGAK